MPYLTQLAEIARRTGHPVTEVSGWKTRGHGPQPAVEGVVCHHTAGPASGDYPSLNVVRNGRPGLDGPLSHFGLGRTGRIYVIAAGRCWHNAPSTSPFHDNSSSIGIEAENTGTGQAWPAAQLDAYRRLCAEICREFNLPVSRVRGHREVNTNKIDPKGIDMNTFRAAVGNLLKATSPTLEDDMPEPKDLWNWDGIAAPPWIAEEGNKNWSPASYLHWQYRNLANANAKLDALVKASGQKVDVDEGAIVAGVLAGLTPAAVASAVVDAMPPELAQQVVDELNARLQS